MKILWLQTRARTSHLQTECPWCESESGFKKEIPDEVLGEEEMTTNTKRFLMLPRQQSKEVGQMTPTRSNNWLVLTLMTSAMAVLSSHPALAQQTVGAPPGRGSYIRNCGACHGDDAKGNGAYDAELKVKPADLTQLAKKNNGTFPSARVERILDGSEEIPGHGSRQKPVWGHEFGAGEEAAGGNVAPTVARERIQLIIRYLSSIQEK